MHHKGQKLLGKMAYITYLLAVVKTAGHVLCINTNNSVFFWTFEIESLVSATFSNWLVNFREFYCIQNFYFIVFRTLNCFVLWYTFWANGRVFSKLLCLLLDFRSGLLLKGLTFWSLIEITKNCIIFVLFMIFTRGFLHSVP